MRILLQGGRGPQPLRSLPPQRLRVQKAAGLAGGCGAAVGSSASGLGRGFGPRPPRSEMPEPSGVARARNKPCRALRSKAPQRLWIQPPAAARGGRANILAGLRRTAGQPSCSLRSLPPQHLWVQSAAAAASSRTCAAGRLRLCSTAASEPRSPLCSMAPQRFWIQRSAGAASSGTRGLIARQQP